MITRDAALVAGGLDAKALNDVLSERAENERELDALRAYYDGTHAVLSRVKLPGTSNNKLVVNHAKYIADLASAYLIGSPIGYADAEQKDALESLLDAYQRCNIDSVDAELAKHASIYGRGAELLYMDSEARPRAAVIDPRRAFVVYDDTVAHEPLIGVRRTARRNAPGEIEGEIVTVYTDRATHRYFRRKDGALLELMDEEPHYFGGVPLIEYWNNEDERGDFKPVQTLIDAYNLLMSDRINDKEQLVDALLMLSGVVLGDSDEEFSQAVKRLREQKILEMPNIGATAAYLAKQLTEADVQVLADALVRDIHKIAMVPALTDDHFASNTSGVAMKYKLLGLEQLTKTKERWFREGLRSRLRLFSHVLSVKGAPALDPEAVQMTFSRGLPVNDLEQAQMVGQLQDVVPDVVLLKQLSFVDNPEEALELLAAQREEKAKLHQARYGLPPYPDANEQIPRREVIEDAE